MQAKHRSLDWDKLNMNLSEMQLAVDTCGEHFLVEALYPLVPEHRMEGGKINLPVTSGNS
jgi:hypothetical protein